MNNDHQLTYNNMTVVKHDKFLAIQIQQRLERDNKVCCQNPNQTTTQPNLTLPKFGFYMKMTLHHHHPPTHRELNVSYISAVTCPILTKI